jgi:hypothetical protein
MNMLIVKQRQLATQPHLDTSLRLWHSMCSWHMYCMGNPDEGLRLASFSSLRRKSEA